MKLTTPFKVFTIERNHNIMLQQLLAVIWVFFPSVQIQFRVISESMNSVLKVELPVSKMRIFYETYFFI